MSNPELTPHPSPIRSAATLVDGLIHFCFWGSLCCGQRMIISALVKWILLGSDPTIQTMRQRRSIYLKISGKYDFYQSALTILMYILWLEKHPPKNEK
jgi:hypothetical protein